MRDDGAAVPYFPGFRSFRMATAETEIHGVMGGSGAPVLLLHGYPQTHLMWRHVAARLAKDFTVVATDLRGYGESGKPDDGVNHAAHSKRAMAADQVEVMRRLGFERFAVVGHDRGGRVAHRMALDHAERVKNLTVLDIVPTHHLYTRLKREFATVYFHWFFLIQPAPLPETLNLNSAEFLLRRQVFRGLVPRVIDEEVFVEYLRHFQDATTQHAMCEDYRAGATIDLEHDEADLHRKVERPVTALWGERGAMHPLYDVLATWRERCRDVRGRAMPCGHWMAEELPEELTTELSEAIVRT